jgi:hypothetical protein
VARLRASGWRSRPSRTSVSTKDTSENSEATSSAQTPTDIGVPDLKFRPNSSGVVFTSMCQKRRGFVRSSVSRIGQMAVAGKAT